MDYTTPVSLPSFGDSQIWTPGPVYSRTRGKRRRVTGSSKSPCRSGTTTRTESPLGKEMSTDLC